MKIIIINDNFNSGGGVNSFVFDLCLAFSERKLDVTLISILKSEENKDAINELKRKNIEVICLGAENKKDAIFKFIIRLRSIIKVISKGEDTIINLHLKLSVLMGAVASVGLKNCKCVETYHNTYKNYHLQFFILRPLIKKYICVSEEARKEMMRRFHTRRNETIAIPNGVSRRKIRLVANIRNDININSSVIHLVSIGRLSYEKNFKTSVKALLDICSKDVTYTIVGGGPQEIEIRKLAKGNKNINILGAQSRASSISELAKADLVILPSLWEGRSILQLEAAALDRPMVLSDVPGLREPFYESKLFRDELFRICKFGYLVRTNDTNSYKGAINHYILNKSEILPEMMKAVKTMSLENDISNVAKRYLECFKSIFISVKNSPT